MAKHMIEENYSGRERGFASMLTGNMAIVSANVDQVLRIEPDEGNKTLAIDSTMRINVKDNVMYLESITPSFRTKEW